MSRLTNNNKDNPILKDVGHANCKNICEHETYCDMCPIQEAIDKLCHYEDLEEQGRLIEQKYGYLMQSRDYDEDDGSYTIRKECSVCGMAFTPMFFKPAYCPSCGAKLVTKEEAEAKLAELKGE